MARTYSTVRVFSADIPLAVRYSSREVRRKLPLIKNSRGMGFSDRSNVLTNVDNAYRRKSETTISSEPVRR